MISEYRAVKRKFFNGLRSNAVRLKIDFDRNPWDRKVLQLIKKKFYTKVIAARTSLTENQVIARRRKSGVKVSSEMRGETTQSIKILDKIDLILGNINDMKNEIEKFHSSKNSNSSRRNGKYVTRRTNY